MNLLQLQTATGANVKDAERLLPFIDSALTEFEISTSRRKAMFLSQIGHESGHLKYLKEIWGPTPAQLRYEGRKDLGNTQTGDGSKYRGRGLIQVTGRSNYEQVGKALGLPLIDHPELLETPENAARSAAWFWKSRGLNALADAGDFELITRRINGGLNGYAERISLYEKAVGVFV
jgi:putative chitinase